MGVITYGLAGLTYGSGFTYGQVVASGASTQRKKMLLPALKLDEKTLDEKLDQSVSIGQGLNANPIFSTVVPSVADVTTIRTNIAAKRASIATAESTLTDLNNELTDLEADLDLAVGKQVNNALDLANHVKAVAVAANIPLREAGTPLSDNPAAPGNLRATYGDLPGEIDWMCDAAGRKSTYILETAANANGPWTQAYVGSKSRATTTGHGSGELVHGRMKCICNGLHSPWSQVTTQRAP